MSQTMYVCKLKFHFAQRANELSSTPPPFLPGSPFSQLTTSRSLSKYAHPSSSQPPLSVLSSQPPPVPSSLPGPFATSDGYCLSIHIRSTFTRNLHYLSQSGAPGTCIVSGAHKCRKAPLHGAYGLLIVFNLTFLVVCLYIWCHPYITLHTCTLLVYEQTQYNVCTCTLHTCMCKCYKHCPKMYNVSIRQTQCVCTYYICTSTKHLFRKCRRMPRWQCYM